MTYKAYYNNNVQNEGIKDTVKAGILGLGMLAGSANANAAQAPFKYNSAAEVSNVSSNVSVDPIVLRKQIINHEGYERKIYVVNKVPHIGIGFNLHDSNNQKLLLKYNITKEDLNKGLTDKQILQLYNENVKLATDIAMKFAPNFNTLPVNVKMALIDIAFNLGAPRLNKFVDLKASIAKKDFSAAAAALKDSLWYTQVGKRGRFLYNQVIKSAP